MAAPKYEIKSKTEPEIRGKRFNDLDRAKKELEHAFPRKGWHVVERATGEVVAE
jgi:hypothetical protein